MKFQLLLIVAMLGFVSYGFNSDYNPAKNTDGITALSSDYSFSAIKSEVKGSPIMVAELTSYSPFLVIETVERLQYLPAKKERTLEGYASSIDKPPTDKQRS